MVSHVNEERLFLEMKQSNKGQNHWLIFFNYWTNVIMHRCPVNIGTKLPKAVTSLDYPRSTKPGYDILIFYKLFT